MTDAEIDRGIEFGIAEFGDHVRADDAELRRAVRDEGRDIERADADQRDVGVVGREAERAAVLVRKRRFGMDAGAGEQRQSLGEDTSLRDGDDDLGVWHAPGFTIGLGRVQPDRPDRHNNTARDRSRAVVAP
jgi:hypothetical protein